MEIGYINHRPCWRASRIISVGEVYMPRKPKFWPTDPKFCGMFESELRSGFRGRNGELKDSGVSGSEGDNSSFRGARPKRSHILISRTRNPIPQIPWYPRVFNGRFTKPNWFLAGASTPAHAWNTVRLGKRPEITLGYLAMCGVGCRVREILYEVSFGLAPRNGVQIRTTRRIWGR